MMFTSLSKILLSSSWQQPYFYSAKKKTIKLLFPWKSCQKHFCKLHHYRQQQSHIFHYRSQRLVNTLLRIHGGGGIIKVSHFLSTLSASCLPLVQREKLLGIQLIFRRALWEKTAVFSRYFFRSQVISFPMQGVSGRRSVRTECVSNNKRIHWAIKLPFLPIHCEKPSSMQ